MFSQTSPLMDRDPNDRNKTSDLHDTPHSPVEIDDFVLMTIVQRRACNAFESHTKSGDYGANCRNDDRFESQVLVLLLQISCIVGVIFIVPEMKLAF